MTSQQIENVTALANRIGKPCGVRCKYTFDTAHDEFRWMFYRRGIYIGGTSKLDQVVKEAERLVATT